MLLQENKRTTGRCAELLLLLSPQKDIYLFILYHIKAPCTVLNCLVKQQFDTLVTNKKKKETLASDQSFIGFLKCKDF